MEYKKDKRTKNLTLRDIHVGDWVQVWSEGAERYSPPLKIIQICDDGTIYLVTSDEERPTPWEEDIKNVDALPIDADLLRGFGFDVVSFFVDDIGYHIYHVFYKGLCIGALYHSNLIGYYFSSLGEKTKYMHEFCNILYVREDKFIFEWKGIEK